jgi:2-keto-4-pentenoate hydratase/2-oxohepta-3-ene-1,7-dioic acid hydratase in catechol pathway
LEPVLPDQVIDIDQDAVRGAEMKLGRFSAAGRIFLGIVDGASLTDLSGRIASIPSDMIGLIEAWDEFWPQLGKLKLSSDYEISEVSVLAPIRRPGKIFGIGFNYADHLVEAGVERPVHQVWFAKAATATNGPFGQIQRPLVSSALDYEAELVFVVGKSCRHVSIERANVAIFGYCAGNDVSVRDWQLRTGQHTIGKSFDTHAPFGPYITTADEVDSCDLGIRSFVNGQKRQDSNTKHLIFNCAAQLSHLSQVMTMEPGDIVFTGTPGGVGAAMHPPSYLKAGDRVRVEIDGIGYLENEIVDEIAPEDCLNVRLKVA